MTRINTCPVGELSIPHTKGEYKEISRVFGNVIKCIRDKGGYDKAYSYVKSNQPTHYTVRTRDNPKGGRGHEMFFRDKLLYIEKRYIELAMRMEDLGFNPNWDMVESILDNAHKVILDIRFWNDYTPDLKAYELNKRRRLEMGDINAGDAL